MTVNFTVARLRNSTDNFPIEQQINLYVDLTVEFIYISLINSFGQNRKKSLKMPHVIHGFSILRMFGGKYSKFFRNQISMLSMRLKYLLIYT